MVVMRVVYECEKVVILQEEEDYLIHVLDNYRFVKEIKANKKNLLSILKKEFPNTNFKESFTFGKKMNRTFNKSVGIMLLLMLV